MDISILRDWIIVITGILEIILLLAFIAVILVLYYKINPLIERSKRTLKKVETVFTNPYYQAGAQLFRFLATILGAFDKEKNRERRK